MVSFVLIMRPDARMMELGRGCLDGVGVWVGCCVSASFGEAVIGR